MYVCVCKGVTCGEIRSAVSEEGVGSLRELSHHLGVATQCGKCAPCARRVLNEALDACGKTAACCLAADVAA
jgi:bacterioferritin-associated ferredoxin